MEKLAIEDLITEVYAELDKISRFRGSSVIENLIPIIIKNFEILFKLKEELDNKQVKIDSISQNQNDFERSYVIEKSNRKKAEEVRG